MGLIVLTGVCLWTPVALGVLFRAKESMDAMSAFEQW
jgi:hypothetical protein